MIATLFLFLFLAGLVFAAVHDVLTMTIPNWVSIAFVLAFPMAALAVGAEWSLIRWHFLAGLIGFAVCVGMFSVGVFGGGDAKLLPAVLVWIGPAATLEYVYGIALTGGLLAIAVLMSRKFVPQNVVPGFLQRTVVQGPGIPYAVAIALGAIWAAPASPVLSAIIAQTTAAH